VISAGELAFEGPVSEAVRHYLEGPQLGIPHPDPEQILLRRGPRIADLTVQGLGGGSVCCGEPFVIHAELVIPEREDVSTLTLELDISSVTGSRYVRLATGAGVLDSPDGGRTAVACRVEELALRPGSYLLSGALTRGRDVLDRTATGVPLPIDPGDFHGTGELPEELDAAPVLVRHEWTVTSAPPAGVSGKRER
jgi:hypothetical protein